MYIPARKGIIKHLTILWPSCLLNQESFPSSCVCGVVNLIIVFKKYTFSFCADGACAHYVMVSKFQWKSFWLATQRDPQNDWTATQNGVNYDVFAQTPLLCYTVFHSPVSRSCVLSEDRPSRSWTTVQENHLVLSLWLKVCFKTRMRSSLQFTSDFITASLWPTQTWW